MKKIISTLNKKNQIPINYYMNIRKFFGLTVVLFCMMGAGAKSFAFQIIQHDLSGDQVRKLSYSIENNIFDYFFDKGIIVSNSPVYSSCDSDSDDIEFSRSKAEAYYGGVRIFVEIRCEYDSEDSMNPEGMLLGNIRCISWNVVEINKDVSLGSGKSIPPLDKSVKNKDSGLKNFTDGISEEIYKIICG